MINKEKEQKIIIDVKSIFDGKDLEKKDIGIGIYNKIKTMWLLSKLL